jgi:hypothetical protein
VRTFTAHSTATQAPHEVLGQLTDPAAIARRAPIPFEVLELDEKRLYSRANVRVRGQLAGPSAAFDVHVREVSDERLTLVAEGPTCSKPSTTCALPPRGSRIDASISVLGGGLIGRLLAKGTETLLAAGALQSSLKLLAGQPQRQWSVISSRRG